MEECDIFREGVELYFDPPTYFPGVKTPNRPIIYAPCTHVDVQLRLKYHIPYYRFMFDRPTFLEMASGPVSRRYLYFLCLLYCLILLFIVTLSSFIHFDLRRQYVGGFSNCYRSF